MKNNIKLMLSGLLTLALVGIPLQAEEKSTWQQWKKPIIATTMIVGGIAGWLLLDYYLNAQFASKLKETTDTLVYDRSNSFFEDDGTLRAWPNLSEEQLKNPLIADGQLYENARFDHLWQPFTEVTGNVTDLIKGLCQGHIITFSSLSWALRSFNANLLLHQVGSKLCFLTSLLGGYWLMNSTTTKADTQTTQA